MTRQQGLELVELFFGPKKIRPFFGHYTFITFLIQTPNGVFDLMQLLRDHPAKIDEQEYNQRFGEDVDPALLLANADPTYMKFLEEQNKDKDIKFAMPLLKLFTPTKDMFYWGVEQRLFQQVIEQNDRITQEYSLRIEGWKSFTQSLATLMAEGKDINGDDLKKHMPWKFGRRTIGERPYSFLRQIINMQSDRARLDLIVEKIQETVDQYNEFHRMHYDLLNTIAGNKDFNGYDWDGVANEQAALVISELKKHTENSEGKQLRPVPLWLSVSLDRGLLTDNTDGTYTIGSRSVAAFKESLLSALEGHFGNNEHEAKNHMPTNEEAAALILKKDGSKYGIDAFKKA